MVIEVELPILPALLLMKAHSASRINFELEK